MNNEYNMNMNNLDERLNKGKTEQKTKVVVVNSTRPLSSDLSDTTDTMKIRPETDEVIVVTNKEKIDQIHDFFADTHKPGLTQDKNRNESEINKHYENLRNSNNSLWDMRCWNKYHDRTEVTEWVNDIIAGKGSCKNSGHSHFCIEELYRYGEPIDKIIDAILQNDGIFYKHRLCRCFDNPEQCHFLVENDYNYSANNPHCQDCDGKKDKPFKNVDGTKQIQETFANEGKDE